MGKIIKELPDIYFKKEGYSSIRSTVRGIVLDQSSNIAMLKIVGEDFFGSRNHYETPGGGVEHGESYESALQRELVEELGLRCDVEAFIGIVITHYNLLNRINVERFYLCRIVDTCSMNRTLEETSLIQEVVFKPLETWLELLPYGKSSVDRLVQGRDYEAFLAYSQLIKD